MNNFFGFNNSSSSSASSNTRQRGNSNNRGSNSNTNANTNTNQNFFQNQMNGMGEFFNSMFSNPFFTQPYQQGQQNGQQQQQQQQPPPPPQGQSQQNQHQFSYSTSNNYQQPPRYQSQQNQQNQQSQSRPSYPRFGSQSQNTQSSQSNASQNRPQNSNSQHSQQQQQNQSRMRNQPPQDEPRPTFQNTRSNWKKAEEPKKEKKKEAQAENTSDYWKQKGNDSFKKGYFDSAIEFYSRAINIDSSQSIYYSNRGRCYKKKGDFKKAFDDAVQSIELDEKNLKGQLLCGQVLCEMGKYEEGVHKIENGIKKLTKGLTLCSTQAGQKKKVFEKEISVYIFRAKKLKWYKSYEEQRQKKIRLIENYKNYLEQQKNLSDQQKQDQIDDFIFTVGDPYKEDDLVIPDHLCCKITLDLIEDPVTTEAGHTYEREVIEDHFKKNGYIDPFTRSNVRPHLYPNHAVKQGVEEFLQSNPWAFEHSYNEDYRRIEF